MTINIPPQFFGLASIPASAGIGLKPEHFEDIINAKPSSLWFEVHTENYMSDGGPHHLALEKIRRDHQISLHGVSLSIGSSEPLSHEHLARTKILVDKYQPALVSEHLAWSVFGGTYFNDLLPLPYTEETLSIVIEHIDQTQDFLGRQILIENPSTYLQFTESVIPEHEFLAEVAMRSGCGLLVDVNNLYVNGKNHKIDIKNWIKNIDPTLVQEIHLAGHHVNKIDDQEILIDDHGSRVCDEVWQLFQFALETYGPKPSLIEWDTRIPTLSVLKQEARQANNFIESITLQEMLHD